VDAVGVLLTADDATAASRLAGREIGSGLAESVARSAAAAPRLEAEAADAVHRVATDGRTVADVAAEVVALSGWCPVEGR
jgi:hypothetical protein